MTTAQWDRRYSRKGFAYGTEPNDFLREAAPVHLPPGARTLCLGEGEGRNAVFLAALGMACTAVDASRVGLAKARKLAVDRGVRISTVAEDLADYDLGTERWDAIVSIFCHLPPDVRARVHAASAEALRPGGVFLLEAFSPRQLGVGTDGPPDDERLLTLEDLAEDFVGFDVVVSREVEREVNEGTYHNGLGAVVQFIARRPSVPNLAPEPMQASTSSGARRRYRAVVDALHSGVLPATSEPATSSRAVAAGEEKDFLLSNAARGVQLAIEAAVAQGKCPYCWVPKASCFCEALPELGNLAPGVRWALLQHPQEFLRCSSSGKLVAELLGGDFLLCGVEQHRQRLEELLADPRTHLLLPSPESLSVEEAVARTARGKDPGPDGVGATCTGPPADDQTAGGGEASIIMLVLDGSWEHVKAMKAAVERSRPPLPCVRLDDVAVEEYESALINALKPGVGRGRLSTFEACALLLREAEALAAWGTQRGVAEAALQALEPLVAAVRREMAAFAPPSAAEGAVQRQGWRRAAGPEAERWVAALRAAAKAAPCPQGLKRCCVCGAALSSPLRMQEHLEGRRHCFVVAELRRAALAASGARSSEPTSESAAEAFERYSTVPMAGCMAEPPDIALAKLLESSSS